MVRRGEVVYWTVLAAVVIVAAIVLGFALRGDSAVSQIDRLYACVTPDGHALIRAYEPPCKTGQVVAWRVSPPRR
jgi:hypothetical protein